MKGVHEMAKKAKKAARKATKKAVRKGAKLACKECGLIVSVVDACDCGSSCDVVCCGEPMVCTD
jgi:hypothetical protein